MAVSQGEGGSKGGEWFQLVILTLVFTGGGLALISGLFYFYLLPSREEQLRRQISDANALSKLLTRSDMKDLRARYIDASKSQASKTLKQMVQDELGGLEYSRLPATKISEKASVGKRGRGIEEQQQTIDLREAGLVQLLQFAARVKKNNPMVYVGEISLNRRNRSRRGAAKEDEDKWSGQMSFYTYGMKSPAESGKK